MDRYILATTGYNIYSWPAKTAPPDIYVHFILKKDSLYIDLHNLFLSINGNVEFLLPINLVIG